MFIFGLLTLLLGSCNSPPETGTEGRNQLAVVNRTSISHSITEILLGFRASGSLVIRGECTGGSFIVDDVPRAPAGRFATVGDALGEWSRLVPRLNVHQDTDGMWRVSDATASAELLKVEVPDLRAEVINGEEAIGAVLDSKPVISFLRENGIAEASTTGGPAPYDESKVPHSTFHIRGGATVAEALDQIVKKYPGIWVYSECVMNSQQKFVSLQTFSFRN